MDYFISVYFNPCKYLSRTKLTKEFLERYSWVHLIEVAYDDEPFEINHSDTTQVRKTFKGFIKEELINDFIFDHEDINSLTIIDADLELYDDFQNKVVDSLNSYSGPCFLQGFSECSDIRHQFVVPESNVSAILHYEDVGRFGGHTGYIHCYNRKAIEVLKSNGGLLECMYLGGFDTILLMCLLKQHHLLTTLIDNDDYKKVLNFFYDTLAKFETGYVVGHIRHYFHGLRSTRYLGRWKLYKEIQESGDFETLVSNYMLNRDEDYLH